MDTTIKILVTPEKFDEVFSIDDWFNFGALPQKEVYNKMLCFVVDAEDKYVDIETVFAQQSLPINFAGETDHPMQSCWLDLFDQAAESLLYLVTETVATGRRHHLTEKTFKPIKHGQLFFVAGPAGSLQALRDMGYRTFDHVLDNQIWLQFHNPLI